MFYWALSKIDFFCSNTNHHWYKQVNETPIPIKWNCCYQLNYKQHTYYKWTKYAMCHRRLW